MEKMKQQAFKQALLDAALEEFRDIPAEKDIDLELSEEFEAMGRQLLERPEKKAVRTLGRGLRRAILIAAIIAALATTAMAVPAIREALIKFFSHNAGTHYEFSFDPEQAATAPDIIEKEYAPTYIPEGYSEDTYIVTDVVIIREWVAENGEHLSFQQEAIPRNGEGPHPNAENVSVETIYLNGYEVFRVHSRGYMYHWTDNEYFYQLIFAPSISEEECNNVFNSISLVESPHIPIP